MTAAVSGINENFVSNYVFMNADTYEQALGEPVEFKTVYVNVPKDSSLDIHRLSAEIMDDVLKKTIEDQDYKVLSIE